MLGWEETIVWDNECSPEYSRWKILSEGMYKQL